MSCYGKLAMNRTFFTSITDDSPCLLLRLLQTCSTMDELKQIHAHAIIQGLSRFTYIASKLLAFSASPHFGDLGYAEALFDQIATPNVFHCNSMLMGFAKNSHFEKGFSVYTKMRRIGVEPNARTFTVLVQACVVVRLLGQVHGQIVRFGHGSDAYVTSSVVSAYSRFGAMEFAHRVFDESVDKNVVCRTSLLSGYCGNGLVDEARQVFDEMPMRNDVSYSAMVSGFVRNGCFYEAIELFRELKTHSNVNLKGSLLVSVLNACASVGAFQEGKWVHLFLDQNGIEYELQLGTALIDFYAKCGCIRDAQAIFDKMPQKDVTAWTAMIVGLAVNGENKLGLELFREMEEKGPEPNVVTFIGVLTACNHETLVDKAWLFWGRMAKVYGISPEIEHYGCMVDILARSGRVKVAEMLIRHMPMEPDGAIWGSMLKGCLVHGHVELGEMVGKALIQLEPKHSGRYVLLANMYATIGSWEEVIRLRKMMKERDVVTISAWSFIEISGVVHKFVADDKSHSQSRNIYCVLDQLKRELKSSSIAQSLTMYFSLCKFEDVYLFCSGCCVWLCWPETQLS
ncbi:pentatricopeptide repeat-containing protein At2g42920, chloroplastic-like [Humulus lupulus]|uniref:pentatricopeptide repeat-containing protein At2g42920, chloroplastic-like n=1 Tax=Humulus lupulus TaxID=3486 RepID=UPI002B400FFF|nr:pentatricopeptide repeat-containing protein At2g42920, chloroplastic-like [Humulus lupulus]